MRMMVLLVLAGCMPGLHADCQDSWGQMYNCDGPPPGPPDRTEDYAGPWQVNTVNWDCSEGQSQYTYEVLTDGWAVTLTLDIFESGNWDGSNQSTVWGEQHPMENSEYADDGSWDEWRLVLDTVADTGDVIAGGTTLFACGTHGQDELAWMATMDAGEHGRDCAVWGHQSAAWYQGELGHNCFDFNL